MVILLNVFFTTDEVCPLNIAPYRVSDSELKPFAPRPDDLHLGQGLCGLGLSDVNVFGLLSKDFVLIVTDALDLEKR